MSHHDLARRSSRRRIIMGICFGALLVVVAIGGYYFYSRYVESEAIETSRKNLKRIALAMHMYHDHRGEGSRPQGLPTHAIYNGKFGGKPLFSWRVAILPFIGEETLFKRFNLKEPWDSPHNKALIKEMPKIYVHPWDAESGKKGLTYYQVFVGGNETLFPRSFPPGAEPITSAVERSTYGQLGIKNIANIPDGMSNTILVIEAADPTPWTKPADIVYSSKKDIPKLGIFDGVVLAAMCDGNVHEISRNISDRTLRRAITPSDSQVLGGDW